MKFSKVLLSTNQNRALIIKNLIFSDINQSEASFNSHGIFQNNVKQSELSFNSHGIFNKFNVNQLELTFNSHEIFNKFNVNQSELSCTSHEFLTILISFVDIEDSFTDSICGNNQSE